MSEEVTLSAKMTPEQLADFEEFSSFRRALSSESDRGCALFAASFLDNRLARLLTAILAGNPENELLTGTAPLATFSARIKMLYFLGVISEHLRSELDMIRKIRNEFAHHAVAVSFETARVADRCRNLQFSMHESDATARAMFVNSVSGVAGLMQKLHLEAVKFTVAADERPTKEQRRKTREDAEKLTQNFKMVVQLSTDTP